jgi:hypothetical protein
MGYAQRDVRVGDPWIKRAEAERPLGIFDSAFGVAGMTKDNGSKEERYYRRRVHL